MEDVPHITLGLKYMQLQCLRYKEECETKFSKAPEGIRLPREQLIPKSFCDWAVIQGEPHVRIGGEGTVIGAQCLLHQHDAVVCGCKMLSTQWALMSATHFSRIQDLRLQTFPILPEFHVSPSVPKFLLPLELTWDTSAFYYDSSYQTFFIPP